MPWSPHNLPGKPSERWDGNQDTVVPGVIPDDLPPGAHLWVANVAFYLTDDEVRRAIGDEGEAPHLSASQVINIRVACGKCLALGEGLAVNDPCPGRPT